MSKITFTNISHRHIDKNFYPLAASKCLPGWYKETDPYIDSVVSKISSNATIKKCIPVYDSISSGYLILLPCDIKIKKGLDDNYITEVSNPLFSDMLIGHHPRQQAEKHPHIKYNSIPKWMNPWAIKTSRGYSCLITTPLHRDLPFKLLEGIVDTDKFNYAINFPVIFNEEFEGTLEAGTPIAQIIPFKRQDFKMNIGEDVKDAESITKEITPVNINVYKKKLWSKKEYK